MSRVKRFQIPVTDEENRLLHRAARLEGIPAAEWARTRLKQEAERALTRGHGLTAQEVVLRLADLNAPVSDWESMKSESLRGRYEDRLS
mgnify:CR=1 FL=1